jgi:hypothetical protein
MRNPSSLGYAAKCFTTINLLGNYFGRDPAARGYQP